MHKDTIVAPVTPPGEGGVAIIRLSGSQAEEKLAPVFRPRQGGFPLPDHRLVLGHFVTLEGTPVDEVFAVVMRAPRSYTAEDVVEIHCHGGPRIVRTLLDTFIRLQVRLAEPGEFTLRAFLNGRLDLAQSEAVIDLIRSRSESAGRAALAQLEGDLSRAIQSLREPLVRSLALVEAYIDFPEDDLPESDDRQLFNTVESTLQRIRELCASFDQGRILREGLSVLILGRPNVGKSSLLNALVGEARAIVTEIPGTTRDLIEEQISLGGLSLRLIDTAGIRSSGDLVEQEGVRRAQQKISVADLVLLVLDGSRPLETEDLEALALCRAKPLVVVSNKSDLGVLPLPGELSGFPRVEVSAHTGEGLAELRQIITATCLHEASAGEEGVVLCDRRHYEALVRCGESLQRFIEGRNLLSPELLALELRDALDALGRVTGETTPDEILDHIFSRFCIGK